MQQKKADPADEVSQSRFCSCFGYLNFTQCYQDCLINCNWCKLCCNCNRALAGTCACIDKIGCKRCC